MSCWRRGADSNPRAEPDRSVVVVFGPFTGNPQANERHFAFMLEKLAEVGSNLRERDIRFVICMQRSDAACLALASATVLIVCDRGYLRHQKHWREAVAREAQCQVVQVEGDVAVPVDRVSNKREHAARALRAKIGRLVKSFLDDVPSHRLDSVAADADRIGRRSTTSSECSSHASSMFSVCRLACQTTLQDTAGFSPNRRRRSGSVPLVCGARRGSLVTWRGGGVERRRLRAVG